MLSHFSLERRNIMLISSRLQNSKRSVLEALEVRRLFSSAIVQTNLVSDDTNFTPAQVQDANLVNPWGLTASPKGAWSIANEDSETSTSYNTSSAQVSVVPPVFNVPGGPAGAVFNGSVNSFNGDVFVFANTDGAISGWKPADGNNAVVETSHSGALYLGLAITKDSNGARLYAADFANNSIDVYDRSFQSLTNLPGNFSDSK